MNQNVLSIFFTFLQEVSSPESIWTADNNHSREDYFLIPRNDFLQTFEWWQICNGVCSWKSLSNDGSVNAHLKQKILFVS